MRQGKNGKMERKRREIVKGRRNLFGMYQNGNFYTGRKHFMLVAGKKLGNVTLHPLKNIPLTPLYIDIFYAGNFLTSPTFDCTPCYIPGHKTHLF